VSQFHRYRGRYDPLVPRVAELGGQQDKRWTQPLSSGVDQVRGGLVQQIVLRPGGRPQAVLHHGQALNDLSRQRGIG